MSKRTVPDLKELFKQASEIAQQVPESMQEAAFNRAIDLLTGESQSGPDNEYTGTKRKESKKKQPNNKIKAGDFPADDLLSSIDSTKHPGVTSASKVLDLSLMVLQIALRDHSVDGLTPSTISIILTEKFRINTTKYAVGMALGKATSLVNRIPAGQGYLYKIMAPGEEYLAHLGASKSSSSVALPKKKSKKKHVTKSKQISQNASSKESTDKKPQIKSSIGQKTAVISLIDSGFFNKGKTGPEVKTYLKTKRGLNFSTDQLRMVMLRLVREVKLDRDLNAEGQYEYTKSKT